MQAEQLTDNLVALTSRSGMSFRSCLAGSVQAMPDWFPEMAHDRVAPPFAGEVSMGHHSQPGELDHQHCVLWHDGGRLLLGSAGRCKGAPSGILWHCHVHLHFRAAQRRLSKLHGEPLLSG